MMHQVLYVVQFPNEEGDRHITLQEIICITPQNISETHEKSRFSDNFFVFP